jgi:hypothetical protein
VWVHAHILPKVIGRWLLTAETAVHFRGFHLGFVVDEVAPEQFFSSEAVRFVTFNRSTIASY